jgi:hypothetical protein
MVERAAEGCTWSFHSSPFCPVGFGFARYAVSAYFRTLSDLGKPMGSRY